MGGWFGSSVKAAASAQKAQHPRPLYLKDRVLGGESGGLAACGRGRGGGRRLVRADGASPRSWQPIMKFINDQYEKYLQEEVNINRKKRIPDTRVHCCLYFIPATGHS